MFERANYFDAIVYQYLWRSDNYLLGFKQFQLSPNEYKRGIELNYLLASKQEGTSEVILYLSLNLVAVYI